MEQLQTRNYDKQKRHIKTDSKKYTAIYMRERRNKTLTYFERWNKHLIQGVDIEESRIFNCTDLYYIKTMGIRVAR